MDKIIIFKEMYDLHINSIYYYRDLEKKWKNKWNKQIRIKYSYLPQPFCFISCPILFSLLFQYPPIESKDEEQILKSINERNVARSQKDFVTADQIRNTLLEQGIILEDTPLKTNWRKSLQK